MWRREVLWAKNGKYEYCHYFSNSKIRLKTGLGSVASVILGCLSLDSEPKKAIHGPDGPKNAATNLVTVLIFALFAHGPSNWGIKQVAHRDVV